MQCSESFYRECIIEELENKRVADTTSNPKDIIEILKRLQASNEEEDENEPEIEEGSEEDMEEDMDSDDETEEVDLAKRLENIDLNNADALWDCLTETERQEFEAMLQNGDISKIVPAVQPWWECKTRKKLIVEVDATENQAVESETEVPVVLTAIKSFTQLSQKPPADCVRHNLTNILAAYAYMFRYFNGDHHNYPQEAITCILYCAGNLRSNVNFSSKAMAIESVGHECRNQGYIADGETTKQLQADVVSIFQGSQFSEVVAVSSSDCVLAALSDIHRLLSLVRLIREKSGGQKDEPPTIAAKASFSKRFSDDEKALQSNDDLLQKSKLKLYIKKIEYYLSYAQNFC
jgi:hypothetical protein